MPLSPSFPDWLLKRDPTLAGALTNPLFLAFETRRVRQGRSLHGQRRVFRDAVQLVLALALPMLAIFTLVFVGPLALIGLLLLGVVGWVYFPRLLPRFRSEMVIPGTLTEVIRGRIYLPILTDIWASPVTHREFFETLVLEARMGGHFQAATKAVGLYAFCMIVFSSALASQFGPKLDGEGLLIATVGVFMLLTFVPITARMFYWADARRTIDETDGRLRLATNTGAAERRSVSADGCTGCFYSALVAFGWFLLFGAFLPVVVEATWEGGILAIAAFDFIAYVSGSGNRDEGIRLMTEMAEDHSLLIRRLRAATLEASPASPPGISS